MKISKDLSARFISRSFWRREKHKVDSMVPNNVKIFLSKKNKG